MTSFSIPARLTRFVKKHAHASGIGALVLALCGANVAGCTSPHRNIENLAADAGLTRKIVSGTAFEHVIYEQGLGATPTTELHIYIGSDGTPWVNGRYPSADPTPRRPLALHMMMQDRAPALYLGRPCYLGQATSRHCDAALWTSKRYSKEVVDSLLAVIKKYTQVYGTRKLVLIGYSGGGALAALLAAKIQSPVFLLTVGANLDTALWTEIRGFLPLAESLNPLDYKEQISRVPQLHLAGMQDSVVPVAVTRSYAAGMTEEWFRYYPQLDHACCWLQLWPEILQEKPWDSPP